ncbi:MAG: sigma factor-like helix-turn-helix DNA-binding protein [Novosphingobium sp.]|nr:sigma factor-like helix-turn-helix DNA-binding protein [Novosphingobium sp.]
MAIRNVARFLKRILGGVERPSGRSDLEEFASFSERSDVTLSENQEPEGNVTQTIPPVTTKAEDATDGSAITGASNIPAAECTEEIQVEQSARQVMKTGHGDSSQDANDGEVQGSTLDISIAEFIRSQVASTRLINCSRADYLISTTVRTALSDRDTVERECLKLGNFGKRTLNELNALLDTAVAETRFAQDFEIEAPRDVSAFEIICRLFDNITLRELCSVRPISVRLTNGIAGFSHQDNSLGILFRDWSSVRQDLRRQKNMGSKSVDELQELCLDFIEECLSLNGIPDTESRKIALSILKQEKLAKELSDIAVTALSDATPVSAGVLVEEDVQRPEVFAERLLALLDERSRDVVRRRFGFMDSGAETLELIAQTYGVTRERIRQLESKALRKLQIVGKSLPLRAALLDYGNDLWSTLAGAKGFVSQIDTASASQTPASFKLLDVLP